MKEHHVTFQETASTKKKLSSVLTEDSLAALAGELYEDGLKIAMYLSIPTTTLVNMQLEGQEKGTGEQEMFVKMLHYWKEMRASAKERDKVIDLERAVREAGKPDHADVIAERHTGNVELTADCFPSAA